MPGGCVASYFFFFNDTATTEIYTLSLHDALPIWRDGAASPPPTASSCRPRSRSWPETSSATRRRSEEHTSELQSQSNLVCRLLLEKKKKNYFWTTLVTQYGGDTNMQCWAMSTSTT